MAGIKIDREKAKAAGYTDADIDQFERTATQFSPTVMGQQQEPETQKLRSALQGTTFKFADEAEAYLRSVGGEDYNTALKDIRAKLKNYEKSRPVESGLIEAGASIPISVAMSYLTGGGSTSATTQSLFPALARVAGVGAAQGAATGASQRTVDF